MLTAFLPLIGWWTYGLFDLDEGFYGAIAAEMNRRGEWITPYFNGHPWFEKPILLYWLAKPCLALFGEAVGPRLPSVLATMATIGLLAWFAQRRLRAWSACWAPVVYGGGLLVVAAGRMMLTDPLLVACLTATLLLFWESLESESRVGWRVGAAAALGLAVLAKGPVAAILFVLTAGFTYWRIPSMRKAYRGGWLLPTAAFTAVVALWYVPAYLANGEVFVQKFLIEQNIGRFTGGDAAHTIGPAGLLIYPAVLFLGMLPWSVAGVRALVHRDSTDHPVADGDEKVRTYLRIWFWVVFVFFSLSGAKLPHYILPAAAPFALLAADRLSVKEPTWRAVAWIGFVWAFAQAAFTVYYYGGPNVPGFHAEVHRIAKFVRAEAKPGDTVALYQLGRREKARGTGKPKIQETSHPSLMLYLDRDTLETDRIDEIEQAKRPVWVITRWNRFTPEERRANHLEDVATPFNQDLYRLYLLR